MEVKGIEKVRVELQEMSRLKWECCFTDTSIGKGMGGDEYGAFLWNSSFGLAMQPAFSEGEKQRAISQVAQGAETDAIKATTTSKTAVQEEVKDAIATGVEKEIMKTHNQLVKITVQAAQLPEKVKKEIERVLTNPDKVNTFKEVRQKLLEDIEPLLLEAAKSITGNTRKNYLNQTIQKTSRECYKTSYESKATYNIANNNKRQTLYKETSVWKISHTKVEFHINKFPFEIQ